ncbi:MAG: 9-O-acetylesterase, partial [Blautia sp.]|nr:9-O-acetylesterase [Blautia sp.]
NTEFVVEKQELLDVAVGEVWIAGGQSNMEYAMKFEKHYQEETLICQDEAIRFFDYPEVSYPQQEQDFDYSRMGVWRICDAENLGYFSAPAYYALKKLRHDLNTPVGILGCNWGGTSACCWMSEEAVEKYAKPWLTDYEEGVKQIPDLEQYVDNYRKDPKMDKGNPLEDEWNLVFMPGVSREKQEEMMEEFSMEDFPPIGPCHFSRPSNLYHMMLEQVAPFTVRGVLYYQGESDDLHPHIYARVLEGLTGCWRKLWQEDLPFIMVQLAPFDQWLHCNGSQFPVLRRQQEIAADTLQGVYLASTSDIGDPYDIHPKEKRELGRRLALLAEHHIYGMEVKCQAPRLAEVVQNAKAVALRFDYAYDGLILKGEEIPCLILKDRKGKSLKPICTEVTDKDTVTLTLAKTETVSEVWLAYEPYYEMNLYNSENLPSHPCCYILV